jgi:uncharacterized phosphatase
MIVQKEFYFVRHGQTDHNLLECKDKGDHPHDIPLNATGKAQAAAIIPIVSSLPVQTICASPMRRAQETKEIAAASLQAVHCNVEDLGECTMEIWRELVKWGMNSPLPADGSARHFIERVRRGLNHALSLPGPVLIVAHGGVHWATCCLMGIETHSWVIENCGIVHFSYREEEQWTATRLA